MYQQLVLGVIPRILGRTITDKSKLANKKDFYNFIKHTMATVLGISTITNYEVRIYVETANEIFERCFLNARISEKKNWPQLLEMAIDAQFSDNPLSAKFLRNKYNTIQQLLSRKEPSLEISFFHISLLPLAKFAGIADYMQFNKAYGSLAMPLIYTDRPFKLFDILRVADQGTISPDGSGWKYTGEDGTIICGQTKSADLYTMPGDRHACWVAVTYSNGETDKIAYFAGLPQSGLPVQTPTDSFLSFFEVA